MDEIRELEAEMALLMSDLPTTDTVEELADWLNRQVWVHERIKRLREAAANDYEDVFGA